MGEVRIIIVRTGKKKKTKPLVLATLPHLESYDPLRG